MHRKRSFGPVWCGGRIAEAIIIILAMHLKDQAVPTRDEVDPVKVESVVNLRLRNRTGQLAAHRRDRLVAEQGTGAIARGVD